MSIRINITLKEPEYEKLVESYKGFIKGYDRYKYDRGTPPSLTGYAACLLIAALNVTEAPEDPE